VKLFNEYNKTVMPDMAYTEDQISSILNYIAARSSALEKKAQPEKTAPATTAPARQPTPADVSTGEKLFLGVQRLKNGGPSCISCHTANYKNTFTGGGLARDLTTAFSRLNGAAGIQAMLSNPPFPAMKQAYNGKPLTDDEKFSIIAFLQEVDQNKNAQQVKNYQMKLLFPGVGAAFLLLLVFGGLWTRSKRQSVNQAIYERQIKSE
jgi:mono/diheme cytochrome c family protein